MGRPAQPTWPLMKRLDHHAGPGEHERVAQLRLGTSRRSADGAGAHHGNGLVTERTGHAWTRRPIDRALQDPRDPVVVLGRRDQQSDSALDMRTREAYIASIDISIDL